MYDTDTRADTRTPDTRTDASAADASAANTSADGIADGIADTSANDRRAARKFHGLVLCEQFYKCCMCAVDSRLG